MTTPALHLHNLRFRWRQEQPPLLAIPDFTVAAGETVFIEGPSGSGKTTLLGLLGGVLTPEQGAVRLLGQDLVPLGSAQRDSLRATHIGFIFQMFNLLPYLSVRENTLLACRFSAQRRQRAVARSGCLAAEAALLLNALELEARLFDVPAVELSVGQQQRVAAARALAGQPEVVIADEPTSALDADTRQAFIKLLFQECWANKAALVFVSHDAALAPLFDRRIRLAELNRWEN